MRYATTMKEGISKNYFERMIKKTIVLAKGFAPLILHQIAAEEDPYQLASSHPEMDVFCLLSGKKIPRLR
jgi:hypothetical protein